MEFPDRCSRRTIQVLYAGGNILFEDHQRGTELGADQPRPDAQRQVASMGPSGGPITQDNTGVEYYDTIFTVAESPVTKGPDLGRLRRRPGSRHARWRQDIGRMSRRQGMPEWIQINSIEASPHDAGTAYVAATMYKSDDFRPYLYKTTTTARPGRRSSTAFPITPSRAWSAKIPTITGLLVAGTETGLYISFDDGEDWQPFQLNLPVVPITDLAFHKREQELVVATQGRAFWILDDVPLLYQLSPAVLKEQVHLFQPKDAVRGVRWLRDSTRPVRDKIPRAASQSIIRSPHRAATYRAATVRERSLSKSSTPTANRLKKFTNEEKKNEGPADPEEAAYAASQQSDKLPTEPGLNRFVWNLRYADATKFPGLIMWAGNVDGPAAAPGKYSAKLTVGGNTETQTFTVLPDPRVKTKPEDYAAQLRAGAADSRQAERR